ncbi:MAG: SUMF1/EgtB/PvdO family nonheme iron enzyme [Victivallales bacterium]|jgi:formylglycine-generating enzyme required for sulfatase activity
MNNRHLCKPIRLIIPVFLLLAGIFFPLAAYAAAPVVSGVSAQQRGSTKLVDITYTVTDINNDQMSIAVSASYTDNAGTVVDVPVLTLSGDGANGAKVASGTHTLVWDAGADWPGQCSDKFSISITADDGNPVLPNYMLIDLSGGMDAVSYPISYLDSLPNPIPDDYRTTTLVLRKIPSGTFNMGSPSGEIGRDIDETQHQVTLTKDFYIGVFEVTQKQWERVMGDWPSNFRNTGVRDSRPVERVRYNDIRGSSIGADWPANNSVDSTSFLGKLRQKPGLSNFDLPTEAQWEYACRAGTTSALNKGTNLTSADKDANLNLLGRYWYNGGEGSTADSGLENGTAKVGSYLPNAWGLYDMHGNVWEWCLDWYGSTYPGTVAEPTGPETGSFRVFRGGAWSENSPFAGLCRSASRAYSRPGTFSGDYGFRLVITTP